MQAPQTGNKYIVGWLTLKEGAEAAFDNLVAPYIATCREEAECRFFEMIRTRERPNTVLICESFLSERGHAVHLDKPHVKKFFEELHKIALVGQFENVIAQEIARDAYDFAGGKPV